MTTVPSRYTLPDRHLLKAAESSDLAGMARAIEEGANPNTRRPCRGVAGETVALWMIRTGQAAALDLLLERGAGIDTGMIMAACFLTERATRENDQPALEGAREMVACLERHGANWGVTDRFIGGGLRAIDLLAGVQPDWAAGPAKRLGLVPVQTRPGGAPKAAGRRKRRA